MQVSLVHEDPEIVSHWCSLVGGSVPTRGRPRRLLVFINPHGGRGQAPALFYNTILPLFSLAGIETKVGDFTSKISPSYRTFLCIEVKKMPLFLYNFLFLPVFLVVLMHLRIGLCIIFYFAFKLYFGPKYGKDHLSIGLGDPESGLRTSSLAECKSRFSKPEFS